MHKRLSVALAGVAATALIAAAPSFASPNKKGGNPKPEKPQTYLVVTLETVSVSN
jgi:hypothetical protein